MKSYLLTRRFLAGPLLTGLAAVYAGKSGTHSPSDLME